MESSQEETKSLPVSGESKTDVEQEGEDLKKIKDLQTLFDKLSKKNEQLMLKFNTLKETINFAQIKSIDLIKILRGTQYSTTIEQLFEFDIAFKKNLRKDFENCSALILIASFRQLWFLKVKMESQLYNIVTITLIILITQQSLQNILNLS